MNEPPRSELYDDVYFSPDGWAEKRQVFVEGAKLEERWRGRPRFVVGELGFGCGLSMLATWHAAQTHPGFVQFVSVEGHPLGRDEIQEGLSAFPELRPLAERLLRQYPERPPGPGVHHFDLSERFALTLFVGDVNDVLQDVDGAVDAWFLDGFAPAKNPAMWSASVLARVAALSARGATLGSYTASGEVRRILEASGFHIERVEGFGNKRHRIVGAYVGTPRRVASPRSVAIVGAGIAGASLARSLRRRGVSVTVFDGQPDRGASRNPRAVLSPRINRLDDPQSRVHVRSYEYASRMYRDTGGYEPVGVLRLAVDEELEDRFQKGLTVGTLSHGDSNRVSAQEASERAGIALAHGGAWLPEGGLVNPARLLPALMDGSELHPFDVRAFDFDFDKSERAIRLHSGESDAVVDTVVVASGAWVKRWLPELPIRASRGQLTVCEAGETGASLRCVVSAHGYISPQTEGVHVLGATYERVFGPGEIEARVADDLQNIERVGRWAPDLAAELRLNTARVAYRCLVPDHMPLMGRVGAIHTLSALGSRGFALAPLAAEVIASELTGLVPPMERRQRAVVSPERYLAPGSMPE